MTASDWWGLWHDYATSLFKRIGYEVVYGSTEQVDTLRRRYYAAVDRRIAAGDREREESSRD
jgi:hypothetical protein